MAKTEDKAPQSYVVLHGALDNYTLGQTVTFPEGTNIQRLLDLGAIAPVDSAEALALNPPVEAALPQPENPIYKPADPPPTTAK